MFSGDVTEANPDATYKGTCFDNITFSFNKTSDTTFEVNVNTADKKSWDCEETILFANTEIQHMEVFVLPGDHKLKFNMTTPEAQADVGFGGIKLFSFCDGFALELVTLIKMAIMMMGGFTDNPNLPIFGSHIP